MRTAGTFACVVAGCWVLRVLCQVGYGQLLVYKARKRCAQIRAKRPTLPVVSPAVKARVLSLQAWELVQEMKAGRLLCIEVMATFIERACSIGHDLNLTAQEVFQEALAAASAADRQREQQPDSLGLLFGLPVSLKDQIQQRGCACTGGCIRNSLPVHISDSPLVTLIRKEGGIPFVRSNLTQLMMWIETESHLYGRAENPWDRSRSTGGSSGGETGLIAARCSSLGVGSDIGGSIRNPASWCGVCGFKPTPQRVRFAGVGSPCLEQPGSTTHLVPPAIGPIGKCVEDLTLLLRTWWQQAAFLLDPQLMPLPFDSAVYAAYSSGSQKLRVGFYTYDGLFDCHPAAIRLLTEAKERLQALGCEIVPFAVPDMSEVFRGFVQAALGAGVQEAEEGLGAEPPCWFYRKLLAVGSNRLLKAVAKVGLRLLGYGRLVSLGDVQAELDSREFMCLHRFFADYQLRFTRQWTALGLDVMLCAATALPAPLHGQTDFLIMQQSTLWLWSVLRYPSGVIPLGQVLPSEQYYSSSVSDSITARANAAMQGTAGLPVAVQVVSLPYQDEKALGVLKLLEDLFQFRKHPL